MNKIGKLLNKLNNFEPFYVKLFEVIRYIFSHKNYNQMKRKKYFLPN